MVLRASVSTSGSHRVPAQDRGQRRADEILDAAELAIAEVGVDQATTNAMAERAGSWMGSLAVLFEAMRQPEMGTMPVADMVESEADPLGR